jgi:hypothetical protein
MTTDTRKIHSLYHGFSVYFAQMTCLLFEFLQRMTVIKHLRLAITSENGIRPLYSLVYKTMKHVVTKTLHGPGGTEKKCSQGRWVINDGESRKNLQSNTVRYLLQHFKGLHSFFSLRYLHDTAHSVYQDVRRRGTADTWQRDCV